MVATTAPRRGIAGSGIIHQCRRPPARKQGCDSLATTSPIKTPPGELVAEVEALGERLRLVRERIGEVIFGQREVVEQALITLLSGGHALLIGVPGLAKTRLVETLGTILGVDGALATRLGLSGDVRAGIEQAYARWDGRGFPDRGGYFVAGWQPADRGHG